MNEASFFLSRIYTSNIFLSPSPDKNIFFLNSMLLFKNVGVNMYIVLSTNKVSHAAFIENIEVCTVLVT